MVAAQTFAALTAAQSYKPGEHTAYTAGTKSAQVLAVYLPERAANTYPVNRDYGHPDTYAVMLCPRFSGFTSDMTHAFTGTALTSTYGFMWQCLMAGIAVVPIAVTAPNTSGAEGTPTGKGFYHAPGGRNRYYESKDRPSAWKDIQLAFQFIKRNARLKVGDYARLCHFAMGVHGVSAGGHIAAHLGFAPDRAYEMGSYGVFTESTVPNVMISGLGVWHDWNRMVTTLDTLGSPGSSLCHFPLGEEGGSALDATTSATLAGAPPRYLIAASASSWISQFGTRCVCPTFCANDTAPVNVQFGLPVTGNVETDRHTSWTPLFFRNHLGPGSIELRLKSSITSDIEAALYDGFDTYGGTDFTGDIDQPGQLGLATEVPAKGQYGYGIDYALKHINDAPWDRAILAGGGVITRRNQVETIGRFACPVTPGRGGVEVIGCGPQDVLVSHSPDSNGALAVLGRGARWTRKGDGPVWLASADGGEGVASYIIRELPAGAL